MKKKTVAASIMTLVCSASLVTGATFALFTSESSNSIAITSGKVAVEATIENMITYSPVEIQPDGSYDETQNAVVENGTFANGGTATLAEDGATLTLDRMVPGDKVEFNIVLDNQSNVAIKYRTIVTVVSDDGLVEALDVQIGDDKIGEGSLYSKWTPLPAEKEIDTLGCYVQLPTTVGNTYQSKTCEIVFTVEAIQANAVTDDSVARNVDKDKGYESFEEALAEVSENETIEIIRPGVYAPFTVGVNGVTVKGIVGKTRSESTVIKNTASDRIILGSGTFVDDNNPTVAEIHKLNGVDGVTLENLWIDSTVQPNMGSWDLNYAVITSPYYENSYRNSTNTTVKGCYIEGNGTHGVTFALGNSLTFTGNVVKNFDSVIYAETDTVENHKITGNTFEGVKTALNYVMTREAKANITITDNKVVDSTVINLWDYAQWQGYAASAFASINASNNTGAIDYVLTHFDYKAATPRNITLGASQNIVYQSAVAFDIPAAEKDNYAIVNVDGSAWNRVLQGNSTLAKSIAVNGVAKASVYTLATGEYLLLDSKTGNKYFFTVTDPEVGTQQFVEFTEVIVSNDEGLAVALASDKIKKIHFTEGTFNAFHIGYRSLDLIGAKDENGNPLTKIYYSEVAKDWNSNSSWAGYTGTVENVVFEAKEGIEGKESFSQSALRLHDDEGSNATFKNCKFVNMGMQSSGTLTVESCIFEGNGTAYKAIAFIDPTGDLMIDGCTFSGYTGDEYSNTINVQEGNNSTVTIKNSKILDGAKSEIGNLSKIVLANNEINEEFIIYFASTTVEQSNNKFGENGKIVEENL